MCRCWGRRARLRSLHPTLTDPFAPDADEDLDSAPGQRERAQAGDVPEAREVMDGLIADPGGDDDGPAIDDMMRD